MTPNAGISDADLHALVDGELDSDRKRQAHAHLDNDANDAARVETWRRQNDAIRQAFSRVAREPLPLSLSLSANPAPVTPMSAASMSGPPIRLSQVQQSRRNRQMSLALAAFLAGCVASGVALFSFQHQGPVSGTALQSSDASASAATRRALLAWRVFALDVQRPVEVSAAQKFALSSWLAERVNLAAVPDLSGAGLKLLGGRVVTGENGPAALLVYEASDGARLALYAERRSDAGTPGVSVSELGGARIAEWRRDGLGYALVGIMPEGNMRAIAELLATRLPRAAP